MARILKNTIVRDKVKKNLKKSSVVVPISKFSSAGNNPDWDYKKRLNANLRKRLGSLLSYNSLRPSEIGEFLGLLEERLKMDGFSLKDGMKEKEKLEKLYGKYEKRLNTEEDIFTEDKDCGFIFYVNDTHVTDKFREEAGFPIKGEKENR